MLSDYDIDLFSKSSNKSNDLTEQCYCGKNRDFNTIEIQCCNCAKWFHKDCISVNTGPLVRFMINYQFLCKKCGPNGTETFSKKQASFHQLCTTALANLTAISKTNNVEKDYFSKDKDIIPFIERNWEAMTSAPRRTKSTWHATISRSMTREDVFMIQESQCELLYGLKDQSLEKVGPYNENVKLIGSNRIFDAKYSTFENSANSGQTNLNNSNMGCVQNISNTNTSSNSTNLNEANININHINSSCNVVNSNTTNGTISNANSVNNINNSNTRRGAKRKTFDTTSLQTGGNNSGSRRRGITDIGRLEKMVPVCYPNEHPFNKDGYRYHLVEPDPHSPMRQKFEETEMWAGKPLPGHLYRLYIENKVLLAMHDRAPQLKLTEDRLSVTGDKGYSGVRGTHGVFHGAWYFEVTIKEKPNNSATRIGWCQRLANLQAPIGYDRFGYAWRSRKGTKFHGSRGKSYSTTGYDVNDVLGFYLYIPKCKVKNLLPPDYKNLTLVKFKNHLYYEEKDNFTEEEKKLKVVEGSEIRFFKNGTSEGIAFKDIFEGAYYPAISVYKNATVMVNFGPNFKFPPKDLIYKPMSEASLQNFVEYAMADIVYHIAHDEVFE